MSRRLRVEFAGACYHVINRGNYRRNLFERGGAEAFERVLDEAARKYGWHVYAYVVMRNHFHLALEISEPNLSEGMKWLQGTWIRRTNVFRHLVGRPFQGRYKALLVEAGHHLAQVCHYIHLNPVRAKVVTADKAADYPWSSLAKIGLRDRAEWLDPSMVLAEPGGLRDNPAGWRKYRDYLEFLATDQTSRNELVPARMSRGWCVGSEAFKNDMRAEAVKRGAALGRERFEGLEPEAAREERITAWERRLQELAGKAKIDLAKLPDPKSAPEKSLLAAAMKQTSSVSNDWLAKRLDMGQPASASQFARRFLVTEAGAQAVEKLLQSRVKT